MVDMSGKALRAVYLCVLCLPFIFSTGIVGQSLTIYHGNFAFFQNEIDISMKKGEWWHWIKGLPESIDTGSLLLRVPDGQHPPVILEQKVMRVMEAHDSYLHRSIGEEIDVYYEPNEKISGMLEAVTSSYLVVSAGTGTHAVIPRERIIRVTITSNEAMSLPENSIDAGWKFAGDRPGTVSGYYAYILSGISWRADYVGVYSEEAGRLEISPMAAITNSAASRVEADELILVAGDVQRIAGQPEPGPQRMFKAMASGPPSEAVTDQFAREETYEYYTYAIREHVALEPRSQLSKPLMKMMSVAVDREYVYEGMRSSNAVDVRLSFNNNRKSGAGEPFPFGTIRLFAQRNGGHLTFLGEDLIQAAPSEKRITISAGRSFDLTGTRQQIAFDRISRETVEESYQITLKNGSDEDAEITVLEHLRGDWSIIKNTMPFAKRDSQSIEFNVIVKKHSQSTLTYTVRIS